MTHHGPLVPSTCWVWDVLCRHASELVPDQVTNYENSKVRCGEWTPVLAVSARDAAGQLHGQRSTRPVRLALSTNPLIVKAAHDSISSAAQPLPRGCVCNRHITTEDDHAFT